MQLPGPSGERWRPLEWREGQAGEAKLHRRQGMPREMHRVTGSEQVWKPHRWTLAKRMQLNG